MITQAVDPHHYVKSAREIRARLPYILSQWGLVAKFTRWRLAQDPKTGLVALFGVLDHKYIATHTTTPFSNYFDPHLLRDLEADLQVKVISSSNDGLRYAFILDRGNIDTLPEPISLQPDKDKLVVRVVISEKPVDKETDARDANGSMSTSDSDESQVDRSVGSYLRVFNDIENETGTGTIENITVQSPPEVLIEIEKLKKNQ